MTPTFFARRSLLILVIIFFLIPFGMRGARLSLRSMKNDIKDWLPQRFKETAELDWFRKHFLGEQFVICSWEECSADDPKLSMLVAKLFPDFAPPHGLSEQAEATLTKREEHIRNKFGLFVPEDCREDWGGLGEKWFQGRNNTWYYITPDGKLYRWKGQPTVIGLLGRGISRAMHGKSVDGELKAELHAIDYERPYRLETPLFKTVTTGPQILDQMTRDGGPLRRGSDNTEEEAREIALHRLNGSLFGPDGEQTSLIVTLTEEGRKNLGRVVGRGLPGQPRGKLVRLAAESGINPPARPPLLAIPSLGIGMPELPLAPSLKMGGPPIDNVAIDEEGQITLVRLVGLCGLLGIGMSFACFRSIKITIMLFFVGGVAAICSLGAVWWLGSSVDAVLMSMPAVVYVLGLSGAVHIVNYYRDAVEEFGVVGAPERAVAHGWKPCTLAAITTAMGLGSLCTSELTPIWKFGAFSALGVVGTLILLFTYLPAALETWPPKLRLRTGANKRAASPLVEAFNRWMTSVGNGIIRYNVVTALVCTVVFFSMAYGLLRIQTSVHLIKMFDADSKIISDYRWLENNLGKLVPMELVVRIDQRMLADAGEEDDSDPPNAADGEMADAAKTKVAPELQYSFLDRVLATAHVHEVIEREFGPEGNGIVGTGLSVATFTPELPESGGGSRAAIYRNSFSRKLAEHRQEFIDTDYLRTDKVNGAELWRVSIRLAALKDVDYGAFVSDLKCAVEPVMAAYRFRDEILTRINEDNDGEGFGGETVVVIGAPFQQYYEERKARAEAETAAKLAAADAAPETDASETAAPEAAGDEAVLAEAEFDSRFDDHLVDQTRIFALTLRDLLRNARLRFRTHDPLAETAEELDEDLAKADYVLLAADHESYDLDALPERLADRVIDIRDHQFDPTAADNHDTDIAAADPQLAGVHAIYTGVVPIVYKAQRTLLNSLIESFLLAFVMIAVVMTFVLRSPSAAIISMFPNVFPVAVVFGAMGWLNISVDIGTMMTASVAMGVAVDDTIHFLTWYRWGLDSGLSRKDAIREAYRRVARAMFQTTAIGGLGMAVFALSTFTPTQRFGVLMLTLLSAALVGDLIFLPALLAGPLGKVFSPSSKDKKRREAAKGQVADTGDGEPDPDKGGSAGLEDPGDGGASAPAAPPPTDDSAAPNPSEVDAPHMPGPTNVATKHLIVRQDAPHKSRQS